MITINGTYYSKEKLLFCIKEKCSQALSVHEESFWTFLKLWTDASTSYIEVQTSGSTGKPKMIHIEKKAMWHHASMTCQYFGLDKNMNALLCLSSDRIGGMMMIVRSMYAGMNLIYTEPSSNPLKEIEEAIHFTAMVPYQVQTIMDVAPDKWKFVKHVIIGGGIISSDLEKAIMLQPISAYHTFGMTETISHIALKKIDGRKHFTVFDGIHIEMDDRDCLTVHAPSLYPEPIYTNDIVRITSSNTFEWIGRIDHVIETGGIKMNPEVIEDKIRHLINVPFFIGSLPDRSFNNRIVLITEGKTSITVDAFKPILSPYECPKGIHVLHSFIYTETGKIKRKETIRKIV